MNFSKQNRQKKQGFALLMVLILLGVALLVLAYNLNRTQTISKINNRHNAYNACCNAAEGAVEKAFARIAWDFQSYNLSGVYNDLSTIRTNVPSVAENSIWNNFVFTDANGVVGQTTVFQTTNYGGPLPSAYTGLFCTTSSPVYRIISNVMITNTSSYAKGVVGTAQEDVLLALVPLNTWAIFYNGLLEFSTCATMTVNGRVQANGPIYVGSGSALTFNSGVSTTATLTSPVNDGNGPWTTANWNVTFNGTPQFTTNVASVTASLNMTNTHFIIDPPTNGETATSSVGSQRLYNEAQMVLIVTNSVYGGTNPTVQLILQAPVNGAVPGADPSPATLLYTNASVSSLSTNLPFLSLTNFTLDQREQDTNIFTQIDVGKFASWIQTNSAVQGKLPSSSGYYPTILYVADRRTRDNTHLPAVRLANGAQLPANNGIGFSVATPNPLYVMGNYNVQTASSAANASAGTNDTTYTVPAALFSDALTVLSANWSDSTSLNTLYPNSPSSFNVAADNTINAAIVTGTVPSSGTTASTFSGGVHNLPRLLENWAGRKLFLNTSILRLYDSTMATNTFRNPNGFSPTPVNPYYNPPTRQFSFDPNFLNPNKVPPGIPLALVPIRFGWGVPPPGVTNYTPIHN
jgi:hypothetical protein